MVGQNQEGSTMNRMLFSVTVAVLWGVAQYGAMKDLEALATMSLGCAVGLVVWGVYPKLLARD